MEKWLVKCGDLKKLDFDPKVKINGIIKGNRDSSQFLTLNFWMKIENFAYSYKI